MEDVTRLRRGSSTLVARHSSLVTPYLLGSKIRQRKSFRMMITASYRKFLFLSLLLSAAWAQTGHAQTGAWRPEKNVEIVAPANPGGLHDITARSLQKVFQTRKLVEVPVVVVNKGGGGGTVGWTYVAQQGGDAHVVSLIAVNLLSNHIMGVSTLNYTDFTPLAQLFNEYLALAVRADSSVTSAKDAIARLAKNPGAMSVAVGTSL